MSLEREYVLLLDSSGSMTSTGASGKSLWDEAKEGTLAFANKVAALDPDGIDVGFFASNVKLHENVTPDKVETIFQERDPFGTTATDKALSEVFKKWRAKGKKNTTVLVITDGEPNDQAAVEREIIGVTKEMTADEQLAISFLQIGNDPGAKNFLQHLDDGLEKKGAKFDVVDTKSFSEIEESGMSLTEVLQAAIND